MALDRRRKHGWVVTLAGTGINLALGILYAWSVFKVPLQQRFGFTATQSTLPYSVCVLVFSFVMVLAGSLQDRFGPRLIATIGTVLMGAGFLLAGCADKVSNPLAILVIGFGVMGGVGISMAYVSALPAAVKWFPPQKRGMILGIVVSGFGLASVYAAPLSDFLIRRYDVSRSFTILGIGFFAVLMVLVQFLRNPPADFDPHLGSSVEAFEPGHHIHVGRDFSMPQMLGTKQFYLIWITFMLGAGAGLMIISFMAAVAGANLGFWAVVILALGNAGGRLTAGVVSDRLGVKRTLFINFLLQAVVLLCFNALTRTTAPLMAVGALCAGLTYGAYLSLYPSITADFFGLRNLGVNYGMVTTSSGMGGLVFPMVAARFMDVTGSYVGAYRLAAGLCVGASLLTFALNPPSAAAAGSDAQ